jgi:hypothetical protein
LFAIVFTFSCSGEGGSVIDKVGRGGDIWDGKVSTAWYNTSQKEFVLREAQQLAGFAKLVNEGNNFLGFFVKLGADMNLSGINWTPIGTLTLGLGGIFDGNGYVISGVYVNNPDSSYQGLFAGTENTGEIKNLGVIDSDIRGHEYIGGIAGYNSGKIINSYFIGGVNGNRGVGGITGLNYLGFVSGSYSSGQVGGKEYVGGFVGYNTVGEISDSYSMSMVSGKRDDGVSGSYGNFIGGFVGFNDVGGIISESYSIGIVMGGSEVGGFAGANDDGGRISNSFYDSEKSGRSEGGGGGGARKTTAEMKDKATYEGWDFDEIWGIGDGINNGYPYLLSLPNIK